jgi:sugar lactone lactonase YvrE
LSHAHPDPRLKIVVEPGAELAEAPFWDGERDELIWVDLTAGTVHVLGDGMVAHGVDRAVGAAIPVDAGRLIVCRQGELSLLDRDSGALSVFAALEPEEPEMRPNDGKCDPAGRLWLGTTRFEHDLAVGRLYRIDPDGSIRSMLENLWCANGIAWTADGSKMYFTDSLTRVIDRFSFDLDRGELSDHRRFAEITVGDAVPDGMCTDIDGGLWVALWDGGCVQRFDRDGTLTEQVTVPVARATSCCFGGPGLTDLYITTAPSPEHPGLGGAIFKLDAGVAGVPVNRFGPIPV